MTSPRHQTVTPVLLPGSFNIGTEHSFKGYYNPNESWNGFYVPYFTLFKTNRIRNVIAQETGNYPDSVCNIIEAGILNTVDGPVQLYTVGACEWCWELDQMVDG